MTEYRRAQVPGATRLFTVDLAERSGDRWLVDGIDVLRAALRSEAEPFPQGSGAHATRSPARHLDLAA